MVIGRFAKLDEDGLVLWLGEPDCDAAHQSILDWFNSLSLAFRPGPAELDNVLRGNIGEAIAFHVGYSHIFNDQRYRPFPANALTPLGRISKPDIDIVWIHFGATRDDDFVVLQEVKTTSLTSLEISDRLVNDYDKLFGTDVQLTLHSRLQAIKNMLEYADRTPELAKRLNYLAGNSALTSPRIRLLPTVVHERSQCDPRSKLLGVRTTLVGKGLLPDAVLAWSIALSDLDDRILRLSMGRP